MVGEGQTRRQEELLDKISCPPSPEVLQAGPGRSTRGHSWSWATCGGLLVLGRGMALREGGAPHTLHTRASSYCKSLMVLFFDSRTSCGEKCRREFETCFRTEADRAAMGLVSRALAVTPEVKGIAAWPRRASTREEAVWKGLPGRKGDSTCVGRRSVLRS